MTEHEGPETTAALVDAITQSYRAREDAEAQPPAVSGDGVEAQADNLAVASERLRLLLAASPGQPGEYLDVFAVLNDLSHAAGSIAGAAAELRRQERFGLVGEGSWAEWNAALAGLRAAEAACAHAADGWV